MVSFLVYDAYLFLIKAIYSTDINNILEMYSEVLLMIAAFENGVGYEIRERFKENRGQLLSMQEVYDIIDKFAEHPLQQPHLNDTRTKMASRD